MNKTKAIFFLFQFIFFLAAGQTINLPAFRAVSPQEGFTYGAIVTITEDPHGMIWFGTMHGLYSYDTERFSKYLHKADDQNTPPGNHIRDLFCDSAGKMWISTTSGLGYYDFELEKFVRCLYADEKGEKVIRNVRQVFEDKSRQIWMIDQRGLAKIDSSEQVFNYRSFKSYNGTFSRAYMGSDETLWLGTFAGTVYKCPYPYDSLITFAKFRNSMVQRILPVSDGVWIGYDWHGACKADYDGNLISHYSTPSENGLTIANNRVRDIYQDPGGQIWLATYKGFTLINKDQIMNYNQENFPGINHSSIYTIYEDSYGGLWVGTWSGGLYYRNLNDNHFLHVKDIFHPNLNTNVISSFTDGPDNSVWVGTESGMLFAYYPDMEDYKNLSEDFDENQLKSIKSLKKDKQGNIWIGTYSAGIWVKPASGSKIRQLDYLRNNTEQIFALAADSNKMWIGSGTSGIHSYSLETGLSEQFRYKANDPESLSTNSVRSLLLDRNGNLWAGTMFGLNLKLKGQKGFTRFVANQAGNNTSVNHNEIFCLHEGRRGNIWVGTGGGGLNKYDPLTGKFEYFSVEDGLTGSEIYGIQEDGNGNLWVSTENGISVFDPRNKTVRNFVKEDGLQGNQFNPGACFQSASGWMYFGGSNGFNSFHPGSIRSNPLPPLCHVYEIAINHETLKPGDPGSPLEKSVKYTQQIKLNSRQNSLTLSFVANNYLQPGKNRFRYRLLNYDENWIEAGSERKATFTKIPPGKYVFEVVASNNDRVWNTKPTRLEITIRPPVLLRWYALVTYMLLGLLAIYFIQREIYIRQKLKMEVQEERIRRENEEQLSQMKMQFLTNISHEFKTPLSLILSPADNLLRKFSHDPEARFLLEILKRNTTRLQWLINQVIDLQKIDMKKLEITRKPVNVVKLCHQIAEYFIVDAKDKNIHLTIDTNLTEIYLQSDPDKLDIVITNLVSNAMKFTPENGKVIVQVEQLNMGCIETYDWETGNRHSGPVVVIRITDSGPGIEKAQVPVMFDRFTQGKGHRNMGTGIGLSLVKDYISLLNGHIGVTSREGSGSIFTLCFPCEENKETLADISSPPEFIPHITGNLTETEHEAPDNELFISILVVDDDADTRTYIAGLLKKYYRVITATNGNQGYEKAVAAMPDIIISDVVMPGTDGLEMCRLLKENPMTSHIPLIMISAQADQSGEIDSLDLGAEVYISKPFHEDLLLAHIRKILLNAGKNKKLSGQTPDITAGEEVDFNDQQLLEKALRIIDTNMIRSDFGVDRLASDLNMSRTSLYRKLKALTGQSATEFIRHARLRKALSLMENGNFSIEEVSLSVGFNSHSYFSHCFRQHFGKTPSEFLMDKKHT
jgi:signal transduction histidine kinase/ligand-binding sensor domain-containing protein/CheY-like chemotaxis protein/AraC-like DNA-binding protein